MYFNGGNSVNLDMGSSDKRESFPGPQHTSQADGPGLLALIGPGPVTAHGAAHRRNLSVTSEQAVLALWREMVMERLPVHGPIHDRDSALPTERHLQSVTQYDITSHCSHCYLTYPERNSGQR